MTTGYFPKNVRYVSKQMTTITPGVRYCAPGEEPETIKVAPTRVVDAANGKTSENARKWAQGYHYGNNPNPPPIKDVELPNTDIPYIEILEEGYKGEFQGRILDRFYVTVRPQVIYEALVYGEVKDGKIMGPFVWANSGGMNLVKKGSKLFHEIELAQDRRYKNKVKPEKLVPGAIYNDRQGNRHVFLGTFLRMTVANSDWNSTTRAYNKTSSWGTSRYFLTPEHRNDLLETFWAPFDGDNHKTHLHWLNAEGSYMGPKVIGQPIGTFDIPADFTAKIRAMAALEAEHIAEALREYQARNRQANARNRQANIDTNAIRQAAEEQVIWATTFHSVGEKFEIPERLGATDIVIPPLPKSGVSTTAQSEGADPIDTSIDAALDRLIEEQEEAEDE